MNPERELSDALRSMLRKPEYLFPFVSAQRQFRDHYYGLTAAALLEYFFIDMLSNYLTHFDPEKKLELPTHGAKGWDYEIDGLKISHKVGEKISAISGLWDATKLPTDGKITFEDSIIYSVSEYKNKWGMLKWEQNEVQICPLAQVGGYTHYQMLPNQRLVIAQLNGANWIVLDEVWNSDHDKVSIENLISFSEIWQKHSKVLMGNANQVEIFLLRPNEKSLLLPKVKNQEVSIEFEFLPGLYLFHKDTLKDIAVIGNNRSSSLIPAATVQEKMRIAVQNELFGYMPTWLTAFTSNRPPNLYLAQKQEYEKNFDKILTR